MSIPEHLKGKKAYREIPYENIVVESFEFTESVKNEDGSSRPPGFVATGSIADKRTGNRRVYPLEVMKENVSRLKGDAQRGALFGELDHPETRVNIALSEVSHVIRDVTLQEDGKVKLHCEFLTDPKFPKGEQAAYLAKNFKVGLSSRGAGPMYLREGEDGNYEEVALPGFRFVTWDIVSGPSLGREAEIEQVLEHYTGGQPMDIEKWMQENPKLVEELRAKFAEDPAVVAKAAETLKGSEDFKKLLAEAVDARIKELDAAEAANQGDKADEACGKKKDKKEACDCGQPDCPECKKAKEQAEALAAAKAENEKLAAELQAMKEAQAKAEAETKAKEEAAKLASELQTAKESLLKDNPNAATILPMLESCQTVESVKAKVEELSAFASKLTPVKVEVGTKNLHGTPATVDGIFGIPRETPKVEAKSEKTQTDVISEATKLMTSTPVIG